MIGLEDLNRLFVELNESFAGSDDEWWENRFTKEGHEFIDQIVPVLLGPLIKGCKTPEEVLATFAALWIGGVRFGWELKEQYDPPVTTQEDL